MSRVKQLWRRIPIWIRHTVRAVGFLLFMIVAISLNNAISETSNWANFADLVALLVVLAGLFFWARRSMDRKLGGPGQSVLFRRAVKVGVLPESADRASWRKALEGRAERHRRARGYGIASIAVFTLFFGSQFVIAFVRDSDNRLAIAAGFVPLVLAIAFLAWVNFRVAPRKQAKIDALAAQLQKPNATPEP